MSSNDAEPETNAEAAADSRGVVSWLWRFFAEPIQDANQLQLQHLEQMQQSRAIDWRTIIVLVSVAMLLTFRAYCFGFSQMASFSRWVSPWWPSATEWTRPENAEFARLAFWAIGQDIVYVLFPLFAIKVIFRENLSDYGLKLRGMFQHGAIYVVMMAIMAPLVLWLSRTESFQTQYPFYHLAPGEPLWPKLFVWELLYATQFVALEFFFRGFMVHGLKHRFGASAVLVMMVPYCMIHFGKPMPETFGAIAAGIALGLMSLKTKSIWMGAALHISVAWSMDTAAILARGS